MAYKKIVVNDEVLIDLTNDTVEPENLHIGKTAHKANGEVVTGTAKTYDQGYSAAMQMTSTATALAENIHSGKTAWVNGEEIIGTAKTYDEGAALVTKTLYGMYVLKKNLSAAKDLADFRFDATDKGIYSYIGDVVAEDTWGDCDLEELTQISKTSNNFTLQKSYISQDYWSDHGTYYDFGQETWKWLKSSQWSGFDISNIIGELPSDQRVVVIFTEPLVVPEYLYNFFRDYNDNLTTDFIMYK